LLEGGTNPAAAHAPVGVLNDVNNPHLHASTTSQALQKLCIAGASVTKAEVGPYSNPFGLKGLQQNGICELFSAELRQLFGEWHEHQLFDAQRLEQGQLLLGEVEAQSCFPKQHFAGVGPEAHHAWNGTDLWIQSVAGRRNHGAVTSMDSIEAAKGQGGGPAGILWRAERDQRGAGWTL
jgi:hypothetical protein